jgi:hypothetical protein
MIAENSEVIERSWINELLKCLTNQPRLDCLTSFGHMTHMN